MSPKIKDYYKKDKAKIRPQKASGEGVGFVTPAEKKEYSAHKAITFKLINLTSLANGVKRNDRVIPFENNNIIYIQNGMKVIGEAPTWATNKISNILSRGFRPDGFISKAAKDKKDLSIEVTIKSG